MKGKERRQRRRKGDACTSRGLKRYIENDVVVTQFVRKGASAIDANEAERGSLRGR